jgi:hypothetical protein
MAFVIGIPSAQEILRNVQDDLNESSGVYAILNSPPFKTQKGRPISMVETNRPNFWIKLTARF